MSSFILRLGAAKPLGTTETHYGNGDEASTSYTDADVLDIPLPEHTYQRPLPPVYSPLQSNISCFGLPYQDHNYGMPPPPSPPRAPSPRPPSPLQVNGVIQMEEEVKTSPMVSVVEEVVEDSITRCICGYLHDDGYMICCDKCSVWQHIDCMGVDRNCIPENYYCEICQPRTLDAVQAKILQKRKREELAARNVLSDSSATDTDPEEAANALASVGKKLPVSKKKSLKQRRNTKLKEKGALKMKVNKTNLPNKLKKAEKKEKENIKTNKPKKVFKAGARKRKGVKSQPLLSLDQTCGDPWNSTISPWTDSYENAEESVLSSGVKAVLQNSGLLSQSADIPSLPNKLQAQLISVADVKKNRKGLKAVEGIPTGHAIIEYKGQVMLKQEYEQNAALMKEHKPSLHPFVLFYSKLDVHLCVDAGKYGNEARFVRRSCNPNAEVQCVSTGGSIHLVITAKKQIVRDTEITIAFDYDFHNSSVLVECACNRNSCAVSRFWKKKTSQKSPGKETPVRRRRQSSSENKKAIEGPQKIGSPLSSPKKISSPVIALQLSPEAISPPALISPVKLSNVSTLLAASALLDGQLNVSSDIGISLSGATQVPFQPVSTPTPQGKPVSSRRGSRVADEIKEEKPSISNTHAAKDKPGKIKEKAKEKETKESPAPAHVDVKRERRLSFRRQSQEEPESDEEDKKAIISQPPDNEKHDNEESTSGDGRKKMTREERKLDAIIKAFEKLEKREERRKEAIAKGDGPDKKAATEVKGKKPKDDQEEPEIKEDCQDDHLHQVTEVKTEPEDPKNKDQSEISESVQTGSATLTVSDVTPPPPIQESKPVKEEPPQKTVRKAGKRKRRRSRVQSAIVTSDTHLLSQDESSTNSTTGPTSSASVPSTPAPTLVESSNCDMDGLEEITYTKSKKHLFNEWSTKHGSENNKQEEEMFVQCIPSTRGNAMDHLQRRNSHSSGCQKTFEPSGGFAKKRWLRQAMHEVPAPVNVNQSLSVATDNGSVSPVYGCVSPNPGSGLGSPGTPASPLDFVTPLKKRRLMRESLSGESNDILSSYGSGLLSENSVPVASRINGFKQSFMAHRHSVDDRLLIEKGEVQQNGIRESRPSGNKGSLTKATAASVSVCLKFDSAPSESGELNHRLHSSDHNTLNSLPLPVSSSHPVNGIVSRDSINSVSASISKTNLPVKFEAAFDKGILKTETSSMSDGLPSVSDSKDKGLAVLSPPCSSYGSESAEESSHSSLSRHVLVNSVYSSGVNNLIESSSEAGCVVTKSIMEADGPATVCVDLNAHEMEPSSLSTDKAIVDLNRDLFSLDSEGDRKFSDIQNDCQVNSSEDVSGVRQPGHSFSCDNSPMDISPSHADGNPDEGQSQMLGSRKSRHEVIEVVDSSEQIVRSVESKMKNEEPGPSSSSCSVILPFKNDFSSISSSGQSIGSMDKEEDSSHGKGTECDSMETINENSEYCDSGSAGVFVVNCSNFLGQESSIDSDSEERRGSQFCDSADNRVSSAPQTSDIVGHVVEESMEEDCEDATVSESGHSEQQSILLSKSDSNVDSTSSEQLRATRNCSPWPGNLGNGVSSHCDSNYEREPSVNGLLQASVDDSSAEEVGVSSSSALHSHSCDGEAPWEDERRNEVVREALPDNAVSTVSSDHSGNVSPSPDVTSGTSTWTNNSPHQESSHEALPSSSLSSSPGSVNSAIISSNILGTPSSHPLEALQPSTPSSHSLEALLPSTPSSVSSQEETSESNATSSGLTTSCVADQVTVSLSPVQSSSAAATSTSEAVPAAKKKVSLLEYRKRLKEKPPASPIEVKSPPTTSPPTTSVTLSSLAARFLSCGPSSTTTMASSSSQYKKHKMPTLATLPLFKAADKTKGEQRLSKVKRKPEKQLSLTERLRLEFGLDDCGEELAKKPENGSVDSSSGNIDDSVPPPPPPPGRTYPYPPVSNPPNGSSRSTSNFSVSSSSTSRNNYHGSVMNGGLGSCQVYPQQSSISSTSISPSHVRETNGSGYHLPSSHPAHPAAPSYHHHLQQATVALPSSSVHNPSVASWSSLNTPPLYPSSSASAQPTSTSSTTHPQPRPFDYSNTTSPHSHVAVSGNNFPDEYPPPPPPLPPPPPPPRLHHHSSSSSSHRHHNYHHHHSSSKNKSKKAASSTPSSSSCSHYSDKKGRF